MRKTRDAMIRARATVAIKRDAEKIFDQLGLTPSQAISLFYRQVSLRRGLPFHVEVPANAPGMGRGNKSRSTKARTPKTRNKKKRRQTRKR